MSHFDKRAENWDNGDIRVNGAKTIANAINAKVALKNNMHIMDFGVGTGLLGFLIAGQVKKVYGVDTSTQMLAKLQEKNTPELSIEAINQDIVKNPLTQTFDGLVSSMTLHHVEDLKAFFDVVYTNINDNGFIAIADLETEDGIFHSDNAGVFHFGFDEKELCRVVESCGFKDVQFENINTINKPHRDFGVFLLTATT
ncbi:MAG: class I SAM-dependent methyltransferase [Campylobacterota bacterium]